MQSNGSNVAHVLTMVAISWSKLKKPPPDDRGHAEQPLHHSNSIIAITTSACSEVDYANTSRRRGCYLRKWRFQDLQPQGQGGVPIEVFHRSARLQRSSILLMSTRKLLSSLWLPFGGSISMVLRSLIGSCAWFIGRLPTIDLRAHASGITRSCGEWMVPDNTTKESVRRPTTSLVAPRVDDDTFQVAMVNQTWRSACSWVSFTSQLRC